MRLPSLSPRKAPRRGPAPPRRPLAVLRLEELEQRSLPGALSLSHSLFSFDALGSSVLDDPGLSPPGANADRATTDDNQEGGEDEARRGPGGVLTSTGPQSAHDSGDRAVPAAVTPGGLGASGEVSSLVFTAGLLSSGPARTPRLSSSGEAPARPVDSAGGGGTADREAMQSASPVSSSLVRPLGVPEGTPMTAGAPAAGASPAADGLLIQFRAGATAQDRSEVRALLGAALQEEIYTGAMQASGAGIIEQVSLPDGLTMEAAIGRASAHPAVLFAEPNYLLVDQTLSNDTYYQDGSLWGMYGDDSPVEVGPAGTASTYGSQAEEAWAGGNVGSRSVYVGLIDTGVQTTHPDLAANMWVNPFDPKDGKDNDGNGYKDDTFGWDFAHNNRTVYDPGDGDDHGTHVAGTIGAVGGNGVGVVGMNWEVTIIPAKFIQGSFGSTDDAIKAVDYLTDLKVRHGLNLVAINNSWGGTFYSEALHAAIIRAAKADILIVAAAGNTGGRVVMYPALYDTTVAAGSETAADFDAVICVTAINESGNRPSWADAGATVCDIGAPGVGVLSTVPKNKYAVYQGTSMAAPHVTGAAALYAASHPGATAVEIRDAIFSSAVPTADLMGVTSTGGRLDVSGF